MRPLIHTSILLIAAFAMPLSAGAAPDIEPGVLIRDGSAALSIGHTASVEVVDWNDDGKKDLLVGTFSGGNVLLFLNRGSNTAPKFSGGTKLQAGGKTLTAGFG